MGFKQDAEKYMYDLYMYKDLCKYLSLSIYLSIYNS